MNILWKSVLIALFSICVFTQETLADQDTASKFPSPWPAEGHGGVGSWPEMYGGMPGMGGLPGMGFPPGMPGMGPMTGNPFESPYWMGSKMSAINNLHVASLDGDDYSQREEDMDMASMCLLGPHETILTRLLIAPQNIANPNDALSEVKEVVSGEEEKTLRQCLYAIWRLTPPEAVKAKAQERRSAMNSIFQALNERPKASTAVQVLKPGGSSAID